MAQLASTDFVAHLQALLPDESRTALITEVLPQLLHSLSDIAQTLRSVSVSQVGSANSFGDNQLNVDVLSENHIRSAIAKCPSIVTASSEEDPIERTTVKQDATGELYTVAFDPLDGSSIIGPNWTVGTIIGIWDGATALSGSPRTNQVAAILGVLGPRTTAVIALRLPGADSICLEVSIADDKLEITQPTVQLNQVPGTSTRYFAPANMRAAAENPHYLELINHYIAQKYTLRYSGGLVPDIFHALIKGHGVYISPVTEGSPAKLRRLYELTPIALIVECAGGVALDSTDGTRILDRPIGHTDERGGLICGNREEVEIVRSKLLLQ